MGRPIRLSISFSVLRAGVLSFLVAVGGARAAHAATQVDTCGQNLSGDGFLVGDLDCSATSADGVVIDGGALDLRGHSIVGSSESGTATVRCTRSCSVVSDPPGGVITNGTIFGIVGDIASGKVNLRVRDVVVDSNVIGIHAFSGKVDVRDSTVSNNSSDAIFASGSINVSNSNVTGNLGYGVSTSASAKVRRVRIRDSIIVGNSAGVLSDKISIVGSTIAGNATYGVRTNDVVVVKESIIDGNGEDGIHAGGGAKIVLKDALISGNALHGVLHTGANVSVKISGCDVTGNGLSGVYHADLVAPISCHMQAKISDSTITGNGTDGAVCGVSETCSDVSSCRLPNMSNVTCDTSYDTSYDATSGFPGTSWGICTSD